ncbi:hypothetical protein ACFW4K_26815 [Nocardiopsis alba]|uniref:hypothetical protein n=1 Tax=Nocardiopsis alba TaxID=53437 RepID=UPI003670AB9F
MTEHKMVVINGVRYRPEDVPAGYTPPDRRVLSTRQADPPATPVTPGTPFDPGVATAVEVLEYLEGVDHDEAVRVLDAEAIGKGRTTILSKTQEILSALADKEDDDDGDPGGAAG